MSDTELTQDELTTLKARADLMGITYHPSIGVEKLRDKIAAAISTDEKVEGQAPTEDSVVTPPADEPVAAPKAETEGERRKRKKMEALALVRIRLTCMNPNKKDWDGEIITVGNSLVGTVSRYIPFNAEEGWHVPAIMLEMLKNRQCQLFSTVKTKNGISVRQSKLIREFAIEILPQLTEKELRDLAQRQAMAAGE